MVMRTLRGVTSAAATRLRPRPRQVNLRFQAYSTTLHVRGVMLRQKRGGRPAFVQVQRASFHDFFGGGQGAGGSADTELYDELGVSKDASEKEIKTAYRKLAMKHHPDQGGDTEKFTKIQEAYEVLSDSEKRQRYDQFGKGAVDGSAGGGFDAGGFEGMDVNDVFSQFFGGGGGFGQGRPRGPSRTDDMVYNLSMDLESLYNGTTKKIAVNRNSICGTCDGIGAASASDVTSCSVCGGRGVVITTRQLGPMVQQVQSPCTACGGEGKAIAPGKQCTDCHGQKVVRERKTFDVKIKPGTMPNSKLVLRGESNQLPNARPGDVVLVINEKPHDTFKRQGNDLVYEHTLSLAEALTGFAIPLEFLDGSTIVLENDAEDPPIGPETISKVSGKGMRTSSGASGGDLYVVWKVDMPHSPLTDEQKAKVTEILGSGENSEYSGDGERLTVQQTSLSDRRRRQQRSQHDDDDDDEGGVGCRQM